MRRLNAEGKAGRGGRRPSHGAGALMNLVKRGLDPAHPVSSLILTKRDEYITARGGHDAVSPGERDVLQHGAVLALLAGLYLDRFIGGNGAPRRMGAGKMRDLLLAYARVVETHARLLALVGLKRMGKQIPDLALELKRLADARREAEAKQAVAGPQEPTQP